MNNKNTIIGLVLIFLIFIAYSYWMSPSKEDLQKQQRAADSIAIENKIRQDSADALMAREKVLQEEKKVQPKEIGNTSDTIGEKRKVLQDQLGFFAGSADDTTKFYTIESDLVKIKLSTRGGKIDYVELKKYKSWDKTPLILINNDSSDFGFTFFSNNRIINTNNLFFRPVWVNQAKTGDSLITITGKDSVQFAMRLYADVADTIQDKEKYIEFLYTLRGDQYMIGFTVNFVGMSEIIDPSTKYLVLNWDANLKRQEKSLKMEQMNATIYYKFFEDKVDYLSETSDEEKYLKNEKVQWISFKQQFFSTTLIAGTHFTEPKIKTLTTPGNENSLKSMYMEVGVPFTTSETRSIQMSMYFGPLKYYGLKSYKIELERQIPLGWGFFLMAWINIYAVIPVFTFFGNFGWNYGIIILILTILLKILLFPIAFKTYKSSAKMRALKPDIDELNKKFAKKDEALKKQQATMALYKSAGVNPMAGCIPLLLQMPILIAMFRFFPSSIELRQQAFLWATDLSSYDSIWTFPNGFSIPWYGDHVSLFALLMTISSIFYTKINDQMMGSQQTQMPGMKTMMYLMPVMFLFWFNDYSSGLSYYYLLANLLTFAQIYIIRATIDEKKLHAQIEANKKKPVKKSGFQKRLEDMAKKRGYPVKK
jgi:YidC/Oxa1 family membrane protein insertase